MGSNVAGVSRLAGSLVLLVAAGQSANGAFLLNQIGTPPSAGGPNLLRASIGANQIFGDFPNFSVATIDDFTVTDGPTTLDTAYLAFEISNPDANLSLITGFRISVWSSYADAATSGNSLDLNTVVTALIAPADFTITPLADVTGFLATVDLAGAGLVLAPGSYLLAVVPIADFTGFGQIYTFASTVGDSANAAVINPGDGFEIGTLLSVPGTSYSLALEGTLVPEPATLSLLGLGALALIRRRTGR